ncbi:MAG: RnfABCDGE type electron transport complex subunit D [Gammaproteobacteria bacterium]
MKFDVGAAPHAAASNGVSRVMGTVLLALLPAAGVHVWLFGPGLLVNILIASATAVVAEAACLRARGRAVAPALSDLSAVLCAVLLAFCLPPLAPWWVTVTATAFAIVVAKQIYGGLGANLFNPAMAGYVVALVSFPEALTRWPSPALDLSLWESIRPILTGAAGTVGWDALTSATPLDHMRSELGQMRMMSEILASETAGRRGGWLTFQIAALVGGGVLLWRRVIRWHLPVATLAGVVFTSGVLNVIDGDAYASAWFHLSTGSAVFAAFFIVTDPVSAATSARGRLVFGFTIGVLAVIIRTFGAYPDGMAFAVLLGNALVPLIDRWTAPQVYGHGPGDDETPLT